MLKSAGTFRVKPHLWFIRFIGVIVPRQVRAGWQQEWEAELHYREMLLSEWDRLNWRSKMDLLWRSLGAFWDALRLQPGRLEEAMFQDLRFGIRMLLKNKVFTTVAVLSLALGIGANTAIFSLINILMLRALPVKEPQELVLFSIKNYAIGSQPLDTGYNFNYPLYERFHDQNQSFTGLASSSSVGRARLNVNESSNSVESVEQQRVSGNFFSVLGVNPALGRILTEEDDNLANPQPAAVISYEYWQRRFGLDPDVVGRHITVNNTALTIVGVMPPGFLGFEVDSKPELWWAIRAIEDQNLKQGNNWWIRVFGRLSSGVSREQAQTEQEVIFRQFIEDDIAARGANWTATMRQRFSAQNLKLEAGGVGYAALRQEFKQPLLILMLTVALVLAVACVNIANLLLARAATRQKEIAVRLALGAGRFRLVRQLLTESLLLAVLGGFAGLLFARVCLQVLITYLPQQAQAALDLSLDARVLTFTLGICVLTSLLFGLVPAWQATRLNLTVSLKDRTGGSTSRSGLQLNKFLVVTQVALSLFLLIGAGLFVRSLGNLRSLDAGFNHENIVQFRIDTGSGYNDAQRSNLYQQVLAKLEALPGARSATLSNFSLLSGNSNAERISIPGYTPEADEDMICKTLNVGPRFFETMQMTVVAGRDFEPQDERPVLVTSAGGAAQKTESDAAIVAVINQTMARYFFGNENPVGKRFNLKGSKTPIEIIGVVKDAKYQTLREVTPRTYYLYYFQQPERYSMTFQLRTSGDPADYAATIGHIVRDMDSQLQAVRFQTMTDVVNQSLLQERFTAQVASFFSLFALLLACIGLYGVMSYAVTKRTNEIGIRMALGAQAHEVRWMVMREVFTLVVLGAGIGLAVALATTRLVSSLLFNLTSTDPLTLALATLLLLAVAALAGYLPARRASRVDPLVALHYE
jgi:predicted permease